MPKISTLKLYQLPRPLKHNRKTSKTPTTKIKNLKNKSFSSFLGRSESQSSDDSPHDPAFFFIALHRIFAALLNAEFIYTFWHKLQVLLFWGLCSCDIFAFPVEDGRELQIVIVIFGHHDQRNAFFIVGVVDEIVSTLAKELLFVFFHLPRYASDLII